MEGREPTTAVGAPGASATGVLVEDLGATVYWSSTDGRWIIEALDVAWEAPTTHFQDALGLDRYSGDSV